MERRDFLKGLIAAAVATQLPHIPKAEAATLIEKGVEALINVTMNGRAPDRIKTTDKGGGWFRFEALFRDVSHVQSFELDTKHWNQWHLRPRFAPAQSRKADYTFSVFVKSDSTTGRTVTRIDYPQCEVGNVTNCFRATNPMEKADGEND